MCGGNQWGKSTCQISKAVHWATETSIWPKLWEKTPTMFWYLYPSLKFASKEVREKWIKEVLPRGEFKDDPKYGWTQHNKTGEIDYIEFNSGVNLYFYGYKQALDDLQGGTVFAIFADEELNPKLYPELQARLRSSRGYWHMVFTATDGHDMWRRTIEPINKEEELFPNAYKQQVSLFDCQKYPDGTQTMWTDKRVMEEVERCGTEREIQRRIYGRFVVEEGLMFSAFDRKRHFVKGHKIPSSWNIYAGIDSGTGGAEAHPAGIVVAAFSPDRKKARVIRCWRGDGVNTTSADILKEYLKITKDLHITQCFYDHQMRDLFLVGVSMNIALTPANKKRTEGFEMTNTAFKHDMLKIYYQNLKDPTHKLVNELVNLTYADKKTSSKTPDNLADPLRYICISVGFDFSDLNVPGVDAPDKYAGLNAREEYRAKQLDGVDPEQSATDQLDVISSEIDEANEFYSLGDD